MSVQTSSAEELPDNAVKSWKDTLLDLVANESAIVDLFPFSLLDRLAGSKVFITVL